MTLVLIWMAVLGVIWPIANMCPAEGGYAVYDARTIYRAYFPSAHWDELSDCGQAYEERGESPALNGSAAILVTPNPANDLVNLSFEGTMPSDLSIRILDVSGRVVHSGIMPQGVHALTVQTGHLPAGVYSIEAKGSGIVLRSGFAIAH